MFLYVRVVLDNLLDQVCEADFEDEMRKGLPEGLDEAYV